MDTVEKNRGTARQPEVKFGPFAGGVSVAVWKNTIDTDDGSRDIRSITINPRRYRDNDSGEWKDGSFRPSDLPVLLLALQSAQQHMALHPLTTGDLQEDAEPETPF